jgi:hypothetical protein
MSDNDPQNQPEWMPYAVFIFWLLLALVIVILVLSSDPNRAKGIELVVQVITALGGAAAGVAGFLAVKAANDTLRQVRADRQSELEIHRPKFAALAGEMGVMYSDTGENADYITLSFQNYGGHPAGDVRFQVLGFENEDLSLELVFQHSEANDIAPSNGFQFGRQGIDIKHRDATYYLCFQLNFTDRVTHKAYEDTFYYRWKRVPALVHNYFYPLSIEDKITTDKLIALYEKDSRLTRKSSHG